MPSNKKSLKDVLLDILKARGVITINDLEYICKHQGRKMSYGEREFRHLMESGLAVAKRNEKKIIMAYIYVQQEPVSVPRANHELQQELFKARRLY